MGVFVMETAERNIVDVDNEALENYRSLYWDFFYSTKYKERYLLYYKTKTETILSLISGFCVITTFASVAGSIAIEHVLWWVATIVTAAQIAQAVIPYIPVHKKIVAIGFMLPELQRFLLEIEATWNEIALLKTIPLEDVPQLLTEHKRIFNELELKYLSDCNFEALPTLRKKVVTSAEEACKTYFKRVYNVDAEEVKV